MWKKYQSKPNETAHIQLGTFNLWLKSDKNSWYIAEANIAEQASEQEEFSEENLTWNTVIVPNNDGFNIKPAMPDRPIVLKLKNKISLMPKTSLMVFIPIAPWIEVFTGETEEHLLYSTSLSKLSNTWFGEPDNGILAYSISELIQSSFNELEADPNIIYCPVSIHNDSEITLKVQRFLLTTDYLAIYQLKKGLFSNAVHVHYKGENVISEVTYDEGFNEQSQEATLLTKARKKAKKNMIQKSFSFIKQLTE